MPNTCYGIIALFDEKANEEFNRLKQVLKQNKIPRLDLPPHITLGIYEDISEDLLKQWFLEVVEDQKVVPLNFKHLGLFGLNVLFLAPKANQNIFDLHKRIHAQYDDKHGELGYLYTIKSGEFMPHASLVVNEKEKVLKAVEVIGESFKPFNAEIVELQLCTFYPMKVLKTISLKRN